mmetsp:Transcript_46800/g.130403  ORF Transcript_46800/g.130403 Transcript_46800/m.130403 type:complete len:210 (-) Transcript_46800:179-808(-)
MSLRQALHEGVRVREVTNGLREVVRHARAVAALEGLVHAGEVLVHLLDVGSLPAHQLHRGRLQGGILLRQLRHRAPVRRELLQVARHGRVVAVAPHEHVKVAQVLPHRIAALGRRRVQAGRAVVVQVVVLYGAVVRLLVHAAQTARQQAQGAAERAPDAPGAAAVACIAGCRRCGVAHHQQGQHRNGGHVHATSHSAPHCSPRARFGYT